MRTEIATAIRARVEGLVDELVERVLDRVEGQITDSLEAALSALESDLAHHDVKPQNILSDDDDSSQRSARDPARARPRPPRSGQMPSSSDSLRKPNTCGTCGAVGFTSRSCGKTHNVSSAPAGGERVDAAEVHGPTSAASPRRQSRPPAPVELDDDDSDDESEKTESPPQVARRDRFAAIEESVAKRRGELPMPRSTTVL